MDKKEKKVSDLLYGQMRRLGISQVNLAKIIGINAPWMSQILTGKKELLLSVSRMESLINLGINPLYCAGHGDVCLPGFTLEQVQDNVKTYLEGLHEKTKSVE